ncbi:SLIT-ROBO Rho GTPase-activating protein 3-like isoform X2 [Tachypleus tridentatus]|uniref:SLIT-ROBO Rho GTPase-activating protein 3-like isoform X2 n=1 Tax=Tachypleus tridentatus TaxID=6853 RepID=UPI003FD053FC
MSPYLDELIDIRQQLNEQLKCLDLRVEIQASIINEFQDFIRRRAEVELEYSRSLEKLAKSFTLRHKAEKQKRGQWHLFCSNLCWEHLLSITRTESKNRAILSDIFANPLVSCLGQITEDVQRIYRRCRGVKVECQTELLNIVHELHISMRTYQAYHSDQKQMESKLRLLKSQKTKLEESTCVEKLRQLKKYCLVMKDLQKREFKYSDAKLKSMKARNDYLLGMEAANTAVQKYYIDQLPDLIDCMDFGLYSLVAQAFKMYISAEECLQNSRQNNIDSMVKCISKLDARLDKQRFLEYNNSAFMLPKKFEFQTNKGDKVPNLCLDKGIKEELEQQHEQLHKQLTALKVESEELWKTLQTAECSLLEIMSKKNYDCSDLFAEENSTRSNLKEPETMYLKLRADKQEIEEFYLSKFQKYTLNSNLIARLQAKADLMHQAIMYEPVNGIRASANPLQTHMLPCQPRKKRIGQTPIIRQPKLFGGSLEEYLYAMNQEVPLIVCSCIRFINLYGLQHQGIFRVSGSQVEINHLKEAFERGEDPLTDVTDTRDINTVAGLLKLYLRELREPLFPIFFFDQLIEISRIEIKYQFISKVQNVIASLPKSVAVVLQYLFAFLNHVSEFSDKNMMDPYNLATCFGPSLLPIPEGKNHVQCQSLLNELIKKMIIYQEEIFPADGGVAYEKYISHNVPEEIDMVESSLDQFPDSLDAMGSSEDETPPSEDEYEVLEGVAQTSFCDQNEHELSFNKDDTTQLYSNKWWKGSLNGREDLIPDKCVFLNLNIMEDKEKLSQDCSKGHQTSSSSDSLSGYSSSPKPKKRQQDRVHFHQLHWQHWNQVLYPVLGSVLWFP